MDLFYFTRELFLIFLVLLMWDFFKQVGQEKKEFMNPVLIMQCSCSKAKDQIWIYYIAFIIVPGNYLFMTAYFPLGFSYWVFSSETSQRYKNKKLSLYKN